MPFQKRLKIGALLGTTLKMGTSGRWGAGMVSEEGEMVTMTTAKPHKK